eukprot:TRINITY_DN111025_c0_g1_i1.p1 TRINITY_DN111025_c0_g1~~TRINITY_DN111025_c0_g1_i1.p1  ORF type:complete len:334 (+),score=-5.23 TRINITY_DN111025_c0_g1_i1:99-1100(+)
MPWAVNTKCSERFGNDGKMQAPSCVIAVLAAVGGASATVSIPLHLAQTAGSCEFLRGQWFPVTEDTEAQPVCRTRTPCQPDQGWRPFGGSCYKVLPGTVPYEIAVITCTEHNSTIASLPSQDTNEFVQRELCSDKACWLGLEAAIDNFTNSLLWSWADNTPFQYANWYSTSPGHRRTDTRAIMSQPVLCELATVFQLIADVRMAFLLLVALAIVLTSCIGSGCFLWAYLARRRIVEGAEDGQSIQQPGSWWRHCCAMCAVYYWEGCSRNFWWAASCGACFTFFCWKPTSVPLQNDVCVGRPVHVPQPANSTLVFDAQLLKQAVPRAPNCRMAV